MNDLAPAALTVAGSQPRGLPPHRTIEESLFLFDACSPWAARDYASRAREIPAIREREAPDYAPASREVTDGTATVVGQAAGHTFTLRFANGVVLANELSTMSVVSCQGGGGTVLFGAGHLRAPKIETRSRERQRIWISVASRDVFLDRQGFPLPIAVGQRVSVVSVEGLESGRQADVALINRSSATWHWLEGLTAAGSLVRGRRAAVLDALRAVALIIAGVLLAYLAFLRAGSFEAWTAFTVLGLPLLVGLSLALWFRRADRIGIAIARCISERTDFPSAH